MILSDKYRFVFVQVPHTGSTGIGDFLIAKFSGRRILSKHSYLNELKWRFPHEFQSYFVVGGVRNPLDDRVSMYFKIRNDHLGLYSGNVQVPGYRPAGHRARRIFRDINENNLSFSQYFLKYVRNVYYSPISILRDRYNLVYKFENIDGGLRLFFKEIGVTAPNLKPSNSTSGRSKSFAQYYDAEARQHAVRVFGPFMSEFDYQFPCDWPINKFPSLPDRALGKVVSYGKFSLHTARNLARRSSY